MKNVATIQLQHLLDTHNGIIDSSQAKAIGRGVYEEMLRWVKYGVLIKLRRGKYIENKRLASAMIDLEKVIPGGVLCLYSAWFYYNLTTQIPIEFNVALHKNIKMSLPDYPPIGLSRWSGTTLGLGITTKNIDGYNIKIYDIEKSVCDAIKFRNKIGIDVMSEILRNYLRREDCNLNKLTNYAKQLRVYSSLKKYLEIELCLYPYWLKYNAM